jgi:hypothetical protein
MKVIEVIGRAVVLLGDESSVRWKRVELQNYLNDGYKAILHLRPDANALTAVVTLVAGIYQAPTLTGLIRILDVQRNVAATSTKEAVSAMDKKVLDSMVPGWPMSTGSVNVSHWMPDAMTPTKFLVYPPATALSQVDVLYSAIPTPHALSESQLDPAGADTTVININDSFVPALVDYILYRAHSKDSTASSIPKAQASMAAFMEGLKQ